MSVQQEMTVNISLMQDCQPYLPSQGTRQEITRLNSLVLKLHQHEEPWRPMNRFCESNRFTEIDSTVRTPTLIDVQGLQPCGLFFWMNNLKHCFQVLLFRSCLPLFEELVIEVTYLSSFFL